MKQPPPSVREPADWPREFTARLKAGRVDDILEMYEPGARMVPPASGDLVTGLENIRPVVEQLIRSRAQLESRVVRAAAIGDVAVLYTDFQGFLVDASGATQEVRQHAIEILRHQPDGTWKLIFGDPCARPGPAA